MFFFYIVVVRHIPVAVVAVVAAEVVVVLVFVKVQLYLESSWAASTRTPSTTISTPTRCVIRSNVVFILYISIVRNMSVSVVAAAEVVVEVFTVVAYELGGVNAHPFHNHINSYQVCNKYD